MPDHRLSRRFIVIAIDGCRADRLLEANTPFIDRLRAEGTDYRDMSTVYPARTVTCFPSMLTGGFRSAPARRVPRARDGICLPSNRLKIWARR